ncbi:MAG: FAD:protein FMN transferase [Arachnia sp.]
MTAPREESWSASTAMGTTVHLCAAGEGPMDGGRGSSAASAAHAVVAEIDAALSRFRPDSDVGRVNAAAGSWVAVSGHFATVALSAERYRLLTGGAFDVVSAEGRLVVREAAEGRLVVREVAEGRWEARVDRGCVVDFGAIAKGYAADVALGRVAAPGALVSLGTSSISVRGRPARRASWRIAVGSPWAGIDDSLGYLEVSRGSFSMSGVRGQRIGADKVVVGHVRDPRTGLPVCTDACAVGVLSEGGMRSEALSTAGLVQGHGGRGSESLSWVGAVLGEGGMRSEALSTAGLVLGVDRALALFRRLDVEAFVLTVAGEIVATPSMAAHLMLRAGLRGRLANVVR